MEKLLMTTIDSHKLPNLSEDILNDSVIMQFNHNEHIIRANQSLPFLFFILKGKAKVTFLQENGKSVLLHFPKENDWIGELSFIGVEEETKDVVSIGKTVCLAIPSRIVTDKLLADNSFLKLIARFIGRKLLDRTEHFSKNQGYDLKFRLATFIIDASNDNHYDEPHTIVADYLGVSYRHLLQVFKDFQEQGYITKIKSHRYTINKQKLSSLYID
jgi:CRP/FNR family putative post-exponential-phase nitrogen-starvation transcriptional regulator